MVVGRVETVVVEGVGAADEYGALDELDGDIRLHVDAAREVASHPETQRAAALFRNPVDGELDAAGVHGHAVAADAELRGVVGGFGVLCDGLEADEQDETEG